MRRTTLALVALVAALLMAAAPAGAISFGEPDRDRHPYVGLLLGDFQGDGTPIPLCSGTLISPTVFLTAGHCTTVFSDRGVTRIWVSFDAQFDPATSALIPAASYATHPDFNPSTVFNDVGVVLLAAPVQSATLGKLPTANLLDQLQAAGTLQNTTFVNVGYGVTTDFKGGPPAQTFDGMRRRSTSPYSGLTPIWLHLLANNDATGQGGTCFGDSGGPHFLGDSNLVVSVTSWGDTHCRALNMTQRLDTEAARAFLDDYVTLP